MSPSDRLAEKKPRRGIRPAHSHDGNHRRARYQREHGRHLYGALDLGTNNCRLLIAKPAAGNFKVVDSFSRIVRLGEGTSRSGALSEAAMMRTLAALKVCANKLKWWKVSRLRLVTTEACRAASNAEEFLNRVEAETGLRLEIISRETEARLAAAGSAPLIRRGARRVLVFDIGGGSTELIWTGAGHHGHEVVHWASIPAGVASVANRFGGIHVTAESFAAMRAHIRPMLQPFTRHLAGLNGGPAEPDHLLGTSGTVTTLCGLHLNLKRYDRSRVDGSWLTGDDIAKVTGQLLAADHDARAAMPCVGCMRADLVLAGCAVLEEIRNLWPRSKVRVADRGLREGILTGLMKEDGAYGRPARSES